MEARAIINGSCEQSAVIGQSCNEWKSSVPSFLQRDEEDFFFFEEEDFFFLEEEEEEDDDDFFFLWCCW